jgi:DNA-binding NtrC family response regulator
MIKRIVIFEEEETALQDLTHKKLNDTTESKPFENVTSDGSKRTDFLCLKDIGKKAAEVAEREIIQSTLQETHWNRKEAARLLRVSYKALLYKIQKYRLDELKKPRNIEEVAV